MTVPRWFLIHLMVGGAAALAPYVTIEIDGIRHAVGTGADPRASAAAIYAAHERLQCSGCAPDDGACVEAALEATLSANLSVAERPRRDAEEYARGWTAARLEGDACDGGAAEAVCELAIGISVAGRAQFHHLPHCAQTLYACWSFFRAWAAEDACAFWLRDEEELGWPAWAAWFAARLGCAVHRGPRPGGCALVGAPVLPRRLYPNESFAWFADGDDAAALAARLEAALKPSPVAAGEGMIVRQHKRRLPRGVAERARAQGLDVVDFGRLDFDAQFAWTRRQDIIIAAHGAALTWVAVARPCAAVVELFPPSYYPFGFFGPLVHAAGAVSLPWWRGAPLDDSNQTRWRVARRTAVRAYWAGFADRAALQAQDLDITEIEFDALLALARARRRRCVAGEGEPGSPPVTPRTNPPPFCARPLIDFNLSREAELLLEAACTERAELRRENADLHRQLREARPRRSPSACALSDESAAPVAAQSTEC